MASKNYKQIIIMSKEDKKIVIGTILACICIILLIIQLNFDLKKRSQYKENNLNQIRKEIVKNDTTSNKNFDNDLETIMIFLLTNE